MDPILTAVLVSQPRRRSASSDAGPGAMHLLRSPRARTTGVRIDGTGASSPATISGSCDA